MTADHTVLAATNKYLARSNKSRSGFPANKKREIRARPAPWARIVASLDSVHDVRSSWLGFGEMIQTVLRRQLVGPQPSAPAVYESLSALKPIQKLISEASAAIGDRARTLASSDIPEIVGATVGVGAGGAAGAGILTATAASGTAGAAWLTSALAGAGHLVGGTMIAGIGVAAAPAVILGAAGVWAVGRHNKKRLIEAKEAFLQEALRKRDVLLRELHETNASNHERVDYLSRLVAQLQAAVENLQADLRPA
jgi:hypothetical protein